MFVFGWGPFGKIDSVIADDGQQFAVATQCFHLGWFLYVPQHLVLLTGKTQDGELAGVKIPKDSPELAALCGDPKSIAAAYYRANSIWWLVMTYGLAQDRSMPVPGWIQFLNGMFWLYLVVQAGKSYLPDGARTLAIAKAMGVYSGEVPDVTVTVGPRSRHWKVFLVGLSLLLLTATVGNKPPAPPPASVSPVSGVAIPQGTPVLSEHEKAKRAQVRQAFFQRIDLNHDGQLSLSEKQIAVDQQLRESMPFYARTDLNSDGKISAEERQTAISTFMSEEDSKP